MSATTINPFLLAGAHAHAIIHNLLPLFAPYMYTTIRDKLSKALVFTEHTVPPGLFVLRALLLFCAVVLCASRADSEDSGDTASESDRLLILILIPTTALSSTNRLPLHAGHSCQKSKRAHSKAPYVPLSPTIPASLELLLHLFSFSFFGPHQFLLRHSNCPRILCTRVLAIVRHGEANSIP